MCRALSSQIGELEQVLSSHVTEDERRTEDLQNLQDEVETLREELTFKEHQSGELEQAALKEKERTALLEAEVQVGGANLMCLWGPYSETYVIGSRIVRVASRIVRVASRIVS